MPPIARSQIQIGQRITSSLIICNALGIKPDGIEAENACVCGFCGLALEPGQLVATMRYGAKFTDHSSLAAPSSKIMCGWCAVLMSPESIRETGYGAFGADGTKPFRKWADIAHILMDPPEPPFVLVRATANNQHMAWRAPVNLSKDLYFVRVGLRDLRIRRPMLPRIIEACRFIAISAEIRQGPKSHPHPFVMIDEDLKDGSHGGIHPKARKLRDDTKDPAVLQAFDLLNKMTLGESWSLRFILSNYGTAADTSDIN